jgi:hypothetical protein
VVRQESLRHDLIELEEYLFVLSNNNQQTTQGGHENNGNSTAPTNYDPIALVLNPIDSKHYISGKVSSNLDGDDTTRILSSSFARQQRRRRRQLLCCTLLSTEWPIYMTLLQRADNLNINEKRKSLVEAWLECGVVVSTGNNSTILDTASTSSTSTSPIDGIDVPHPDDMVLHFTTKDWKYWFQRLTCTMLPPTI